MRKPIRKALGLFLAASLVFGSVPTGAFASETAAFETETERETSLARTAAETGAETETETETAAQTEASAEEESAPVTESASEAETDGTAGKETSAETETPAQTESPAQTETPAETETAAQTESTAAETESPAETEAPAQTESPAETETETASETETETEAAKKKAAKKEKSEPEGEAAESEEEPVSRAAALQAGTYTVTANLFMPGQYNPVLNGISVYTNNPNNPFGPTIDENDASEVSSKVPMDPLSYNAALIVQENGDKYLLLPIKNPVFTLQELGTCASLTDVTVERVLPAASNNYGKYESRVHKILVKLTDTQTAGTASYTFSGSLLYAVPLDKDIAPSGAISLQLDVNYDERTYTSASTAVPYIGGTVNSGGSAVPPEPEQTEQTEAPVIEMLEGEGSSYVKGSGGTVLFRSAAEFSDFVRTEVDGTEVAASGYVKYAGSTYVLLLNTFLDTLSAGSHTIAIVSGAGTAKGTFTVKEKETEKQPETQPADTGEKMAAGTYTVTANLSMPGEYNPVIPGITVYANNPNNPFGPTLDENAASEVTGEIPSTPLSMNATLVVTESGEKYLYLPIKNPIFTTQSLGTCAELTDIQTERVTPTKGEGSGLYEGSYGSKTDRIHKIRVKLTDTQTSGTRTYSFAGSVLYAVPLNTELAPAGDVALSLTIDYSSAVKTSEDTTVSSLAGYGAETDETKPTEKQTEGQTEEQTEEQTETEKPDSGKKKLKAGTYTVTANLSMPGKYNPVISGVTVYANNPNNPFGPTLDENDASEVENAIPNTALSMNATLVVTESGEKYLYLPVKNPIFTTQKLGTCSELSDIQTERVTPTRGKGSGQYEGSYGSRTDRIHMIRVKLTDKKTSGTRTYNFKGSVLYAVPLDMELAPTGDVALSLTIDYSSAKRTSGSTKVRNLKGYTDGDTRQTEDTEPVTEPDTEPSTENPTDTDPNAGTGTLKAGTYTVAANIWIDRASSGLPLSPHLTSSVFPPKDPVSGNATVTIDANGNATVVVPIVIQSKVMQVKSISGLNIISTASSGGYLTSITVDLGKVTNPNAVITQTCTVSLDLGELAQTIAKKGKEQTWSATFQVNFSGVPSGESAGGDVDVNALLAAAETESEAASGVNVRIGVTAEKELSALLPMMKEHEDDREIADGEKAEKNRYLFTVEELAEDEETEELTEEEKAEKLSEQYLTRFADGAYDAVYITAEQAESLAADEATKDSFVLLAKVSYEPKEETDAETEAYYLAVSADFAKKNEAVMVELLKEVRDSASKAVEKPEETAVYVVTLGLGTDSSEYLELLKGSDVTVTEGAELKAAVSELADEEAFRDLSGELCYIAAEDETEASETEAEETEAETESEKITITDADSLSAALEAALASRETEEEEITYSNSSGLDLEAEQEAAAALKPGTYTLSVNLYLPGERNTQLPGTTAYMTNPDNPLGIGGHEGIPMTPAADNGTLVVAEDGTKTVTVDLVNPVFTLQSIASPANSTILAGVRDEERYEGTNGVGVDGRITQLVIELGSDLGVYPFDDCSEFPTLLETDWYVPLELSVEFTTAEKVSDETTVTVPEDTADAATKEE